MKVLREELLSALESVKPGLSPTEMLEQSSCFIFSGGIVSAYNEDVAARAPSGLDELEGAVQAKPLLAVLHKMPEEEISVTVSDKSELRIKGKGRESRIRMEAEIKLPVGKLEGPKEWVKLHDEFGEAIGMAQECAGKDLKQFATACVHIHPKWVEAYDNFQLIRYRIKTGVSEPILVKRDALKHVATMGATKMGETRAWVHFKNPSGLRISCRRFVEPFFDLSSNLVVEGEPITLPKGLLVGLEIAEVFTSENIDENYVRVDLREGKLRLVAQGVSGSAREYKNVNYAGPDMSFIIAPKLLRQITAKHSECLMSASRLKIYGGRFVYVALLGKPQK